ncbi:ent-kaurene oxidase-like 5 [Artemisia annua]|uniref:Ent-kaurene oxidase-like 5 n=1 Tax=Artemisia annua TaxID=35608 RepID=A0A2U1Q548_ARTAN|nr:ent-kaurene oxidase-like 5 [Artemisia annua]
MGYDDQIQFHFNQKAIKLKALNILTADKSMVAMSDYDDYHKTVERNILTSVLGPTARVEEESCPQRRYGRECFKPTSSVGGERAVVNAYISEEESCPQRRYGRECFKPTSSVGGEAIGKDVESIYVSYLGATMTKEIFKVLVTDPTMGVIEVDWRDFFPYLKWIPNTSFHKKIEHMSNVVPPNQRLNSYIDYLLLEVEPLTKKQLLMSVWESINEASDTTMITTEWAMYELAKNPKQEARLYEEIQNVCESEKITEEKLCKIPYLSAIFHETLRKHSPVSIILLRYVHENTEVGGEIWENPEEWNPERFLKENEPIDLLRTMSFGAGK